MSGANPKADNRVVSSLGRILFLLGLTPLAVIRDLGVTPEIQSIRVVSSIGRILYFLGLTLLALPRSRIRDSARAIHGSIRTGVLLFVRVPFPDSPSPFDPHAQSVPSVFTATVCDVPAATDSQSLSLPT